MTLPPADGTGIPGGPSSFLGVVGKGRTMKVRSSLKSLKQKQGAVVVRRGGRTVVVNRRHPRWKARQG